MGFMVPASGFGFGMRVSGLEVSGLRTTPYIRFRIATESNGIQKAAKGSSSRLRKADKGRER